MAMVSLIGVPTDVGAGARGASMGPEAMRVAGIVEALSRRGVAVQDRGNLVGPPNPWLPPVDGYRHLDEVVTWNTMLHEAMLDALGDGTVPVMLGGDHCLSIGSVTAAARHCRQTGKELRVIWLDAHADFNTADVTPSGNIHGMPVSTLCGLGHPRLAAIGGHTPAIHPSWVRQIGIRSIDEGEKHLVHDQNLPVFDMRAIDEGGMGAVMDAALAGVDENTHLHVSFDVDFLDPEVAPGVGTTVRGGPTYREAQLCMEMISDTGRLGSVDVTELNPAYDHHNATAEVAVELVESLFGKSTLVRSRHG
jgi:arginase